MAQADTIIPERLQGTQAWDRYAYANNNPVKYNDPSGHFLNLVVGTTISAIAGAMIYSYNAAIHGNEINGTDLLIATGAGAAAGLLISSGVGIGAGTAIGAALIGAGTGAAGSAIAYTAVAGKDYNSTDMLINYSVGGVSGFTSGYYGQLLLIFVIRKSENMP